MGEWLKVGQVNRCAYLATPERGNGPGVLVLHAWWGLTPVFTEVCDMLAARGFVALAPSLIPGGATAATIPEAEALIAAHDLEPGLAQGIAIAALDHLRALPAATGSRVGVIGFSMGAYWALKLSKLRPDDIAAVVAFYGSDDGDYDASRAAYLGHFAEDDEFEPLDAVRAMESRIRAAGREVTFHIYPDTRHWFVEPNRPDEYAPESAALAWDRTFAFLMAQLR